MTISKNVWKIAALLLMLCLISATLISGTFAKYTSKLAGQDTALVAKWDIAATAGGVEMADATKELDLFSHEYDTHITQQDSGDYIIAPGVDGEFTLQFANNSDVDAAVTFAIAKTEGAADVPIKYGLDSGSVDLTIDGLKAALDTKFTTVEKGGEPASTTVHWKWAFGEDGDVAANAADTALGTTSAGGDARTSYGLTITATATQVAPATE